MLNALFGVAYELETPFFSQLAVPNLAPKTELYRTCTVHVITMNTNGRNRNSPETPIRGEPMGKLQVTLFQLV